MKKYIFLILLFFSASTMWAQGQVEIITDPSVEEMEADRIAKRKKEGGRVQGYRIMVAFYSSRESASEKLTEVKGWYDKSYGATLLYDEPNFKVYVGSFTSKIEAEAALAEIRKRYPGARIVKDLIPAPRVH
ncbi:MAG: SPOR domain-containing protein [Bacteroidia bacterium]|jgi:hypothetical protein